jgi:hypothetical protein
MNTKRIRSRSELELAAESTEATKLLMDVFANGIDVAIERQESRGQQDLCNSQHLSTEMRCSYGGPNSDAHEVLRSWGVKVGKPVAGDDMFTDCQLPEGWGINSTGHAMWNDLVDDQGRKRGSMFYKAAFYDRSTHLDLCARFSVEVLYSDSKDGNKRCRVLDGSAIAFESNPHQYPDVYDDKDAFYDLEQDKRRQVIDEMDRAEAEAKEECYQWLAKDYPDWKDETKYWDAK